MLDPYTGQVWRNNEELQLPKLSFQLLKVLVVNAPNVLNQEEITSEVWPDMVVGDETLKQRVRLLRKALDDKAQNPRYIGVVRGRGYRLLPQVKIKVISQTTPIEYDLASSDHVPNLFTHTTQKLWQKISMGLSLFILALLLILYVLHAQLQQKNNEQLLRSIAILPFVNVSKNGEDDYLARGMTSELIQVMSEIDSLNVATLNSVKPYAKSKRSIKDIASTLKVGAILDGSLYRKDRLLHFSIKLIDTSDSELLWEGEYNFQSDDILAIQRKVISQVTTHLKARLNKSEVLDDLSLTQPTEIIKAYDLYLRGRDYYARYRQADNQTAIELFIQALDLAPNFALAYAGLSDAYSQGVYQFGADESWRKLALNAAFRAVEFAPERAESHKALALAHYLNGSLSLAIDSSLRAVKLSPRHPQAITNLAYYYRHRGQLQKALDWHKRAVEISPNYATVHTHIGQTAQLLSWNEKAEQSYLTALSLQPDYVLGNIRYAWFLMRENRSQEAIQRLQNKIKVAPTEYDYLLTLGQLLLLQNHFAPSVEYLEAAANLRQDAQNLELQISLLTAKTLEMKQLDKSTITNSDELRSVQLLL
ncbi:MAG: winged helix-turn-helix domain-containing protein, partial [Kangiellaceae bacterium]|nr:winged helix-turn-helix domain-containing protein [Kangiellaceae bacterium]